MQQLLNAVVSLVVAFLVSASVCIALRNARLRRRVVNDSNFNSASRLRSTTLYLNTREDVAQFVNVLRSPERDSRWITITLLGSFEGYSVSCVTRGSSGREVRVFLSRRLLTSLTPQEWRFLENELRQAVRERNESHDEGPPLVDDAKCLNCGMYFNGAKGYCDWCGSTDAAACPSWARHVWGIDE